VGDSLSPHVILCLLAVQAGGDGNKRRSARARGTQIAVSPECSEGTTVIGHSRRSAWTRINLSVNNFGNVSPTLRGVSDPRAHLRRNLRFRPPENSWRLYEPDFDFLDEFFGRFLTPNSLLSEP
jgi:hypothetical protein